MNDSVDVPPPRRGWADSLAALVSRLRIRAVLFDVVGTLLHPDPPVVQVYCAAARARGGTRSPAEIRMRFQASLARQDRIDARLHGYRTSESRERERWSNIVAEVFPEVDNAAGLFDALWRHFAQPQHWRIAKEAESALCAIARTNAQVALASNFDARVDRICDGIELLRGIPLRFISSRVGWRKPAREFFQSIEHCLGLKPHQLLLVGDDPENDQAAALAAGWHAMLIASR